MAMNSWKAALGGALIGLAALGPPAGSLFAQMMPGTPEPAPAESDGSMTPEQMQQMIDQCAAMMRMMSGMMTRNSPETMPGGGNSQSPRMMPGMMGR